MILSTKNAKTRYTLLSVSLLASAVLASTAHAATPDPFFTYSGTTPLSSIPLGTVLKTRTIPYHVFGIQTPMTAIQLLYRTNNARNEPVANVTSIIKSTVSNGKAISYQSAYDSLNPYDSPSRVIAGDKDISKSLNLGPAIYSAESFPLAGMLQLGYNIIVPDTEGPTADFAAGPEYGMTTLDSIRAAVNTPSTGLQPTSKVALMGYSGGAIGTSWASQMAPTYAPDVNKLLVGAAMGGVLVDPAHNLNYVNGSVVWGGVAPAAIIGLARAYNIDFTPYLSSKGLAVASDIQSQSLAYILPKYLGLQWATLLKPEYASDINKIPAYVQAANKVNLGLIGSPTIPMFIGQGYLGALNGSNPLMFGDGVMLASDVRTLNKKYCASGIPVTYHEYPVDHFAGFAAWLVDMQPWLNDRFAGKPAPSTCFLTSFLPGSSLAAEQQH